MIFVDTSFLVATLDLRDGLHARARAWAALVTEPMLVTEHVLWETVNFASATGHRAKVHVLLQSLRNSHDFEIVPATPELFEAGPGLHTGRPDQTWSLTDCISFIVMARRGLTRALTHDHHFEQADYQALLSAESTELNRPRSLDRGPRPARLAALADGPGDACRPVRAVIGAHKRVGLA